MRTLKFFGIFIICLSFNSLYAAKLITDSLKGYLRNAVTIEQISINYEIASHFEQALPDSALAYYKAGINISENLHNDTMMAKGYNRAGYLMLNEGKYSKAVNNLFLALKIFESNHMNKLAVQCLQYLSMAFNEQGMFDKALSYAKQSTELAQSVGDKYSTAAGLTASGAVYYSQDNYDKALSYFQQALNKMEEIEDPQGISDALNNVALIYEKQNNFEKALVYHLRSLQLAKELNDKPGIAASFHNIGLVYKSMSKFSIAIKYLDSCIVMAKESGDKYNLKEFYDTLSELYSNIGKFDLAYQTHVLYSKINDTLLSEENKKQFAEMNTRYETEKKDNEINLLNKDKEIQGQKMYQQKIVRNGFIGGFVVMLLFAGIFFRQRNRISKEKKRSEELLLNILPEEVADELKEKGSADAKHFDEVTVMFTDFKGFTQIAEKLSPGELVGEIHECFKAFDSIIDKYGIEKIKTIGDAYMCAGGLPVANKTHAHDVVRAALEIQQFMQQHLHERKSSGKEIFEIRIGIHTGSVVAGIVGIKKFAYDIWGDTVNIASRMESSGEAGKVNISGATYELVKDKFKCTHRGKISAKNKGEIDMYFVI
jgi:class 3 adenylate cyclase